MYIKYIYILLISIIYNVRAKLTVRIIHKEYVVVSYGQTKQTKQTNAHDFVHSTFLEEDRWMLKLLN